MSGTSSFSPVPTEGLPTAEDIKQFQRDRESFVREQWIRTMEVRLVKQELNKCYVGEGVNAKQYCKELAERYMKMLQENKTKGFLSLDLE